MKKREALDKLLLETIISNKDKAKKNNEKSVEDDLLDSNWYIQFFESLLTKLIIDSSLEFLGNEIDSENHPLMVQQSIVYGIAFVSIITT